MNCWRFSLCTLCLLCAFVVNSEAAPPNLAPLFPAGGQRGTSVELGTKAKLWSNSKSLTFDQSKVKIAADAVPGTYWLRAFNDDGASQLRPFIVGTLPEVMEKEPNDDPKAAQLLATSAVVNGKLSKNGETDCFAIAAKKGQTIVASLEANRTLKSPMDAVLQIVSPDSFVLEENHDFHGLDPQIAWPVPKDGTYVVRVFAFPSTPDTTIRLFGSDACIYRLTITTGPFISHPMPLAIARKSRSIDLHGWNMGSNPKNFTVTDLPKERSAVFFDPEFATPFNLRIEPHECHQQQSGDRAFTPASPIPPFSFSGTFDKYSAYTVPLHSKKGQPLELQVLSRSLGQHVDPVIEVFDMDKKRLARAEPTKLAGDTTLAFTAPGDGPYRIQVSDLYGAMGPNNAWLLRVVVPEPEYDLALTTDRFVIPPGKPLDVSVKITRRHGFAKPVEIAPESLPAGVKFEIKPPAGKADPNQVVITLSAEKSVPGGAFKLIGKVKDEPNFTRFAKSPNGDFEEPAVDLWVSSTDDGKTPEPKKKKR
jgi:hypothetical protein